LASFRQNREKSRSECPGKDSFVLGEVKMEFSWFDGRVKVASVVFLEIISNQKQKGELNEELKA